ncbi:MAG: peptidyl-dipeptidase, partial [Sphingomonadales bacterium]|nr:peptidyl-dipeptidase [Sphingomonadales bacterium]
MKASVSALALAICLAACTTASADTSTETAAATPAAAPASASTAPTVDEARAFVAQAEKELGDFSLINNRAQWVNNTHLTDDTDAIAA